MQPKAQCTVNVWYFIRRSEARRKWRWPAGRRRVGAPAQDTARLSSIPAATTPQETTKTTQLFSFTPDFSDLTPFSWVGAADWPRFFVDLRCLFLTGSWE